MLRRLGFSALVLFAACGGKIDDGDIGVRQIGTDMRPPLTPPNGGSSGGSGSSGASSSSGDVLIVNACGGTPTLFTADFETGALSDSFVVSGPAAFTIDADNPIDGLESLEVNADPSAYIARKLSNVCSVTVTFSLRVSKNILQTGASLANVNAGSRQFTLMLDPGGGIHLAQSVITDEAAGMMNSAPFVTIAADESTVITFEVDLAGGQVRTSITPPNDAGALGSHTEGLMAAIGPLKTPPAISEVDFGATPSIQSSAVGVYWLDDISLR